MVQAQRPDHPAAKPARGAFLLCGVQASQPRRDKCQDYPWPIERLDVPRVLTDPLSHRSHFLEIEVERKAQSSDPALRQSISNRRLRWPPALAASPTLRFPSHPNALILWNQRKVEFGRTLFSRLEIVRFRHPDSAPALRRSEERRV